MKVIDIHNKIYHNIFIENVIYYEKTFLEFIS